MRRFICSRIRVTAPPRSARSRTRAGVSTGNVYHHFPDKESALPRADRRVSRDHDTQRFPYMRVLYAPRAFPDNIEELGFAARDSVRQFRDYLALIYVDVIEFGGTHIQKFYADMAERFTVSSRTGIVDEIRARLRPNVSPTDALCSPRASTSTTSRWNPLRRSRAVRKKLEHVVTEIATSFATGFCAR
jgi:AcrR family transcriptional regulator